MDERQFQVLRVAGIAIAACVAIGLQHLRPHARVRGSLRVNAGLWVVDVVLMGVVCGACACTVARWAAAAGVGVLNVVPLHAPLATVLTVVGLDLVSYGWHRANHVVAALWRFHRVHHSDASFTVSTALRFHPGELLLALPIRLAAVVLLGAPPVAIVVFEVAFTMANLIEHGDIALPLGLERALQRVFVTPALHRRHHGLAPTDQHRNFGTVFTLWDRVLGTYGESSSAAVFTAGLLDRPAPATLRDALALPFTAR